MSAAPIVLDGLTKRYKNGVLAVDHLDLVVDEGQVYGLLGPNGAGKTSTMRMLLGLSHPDSGETRLFGAPLRPGSAMLRRVGALVESPGFVPHLSGLANLELYWRSGGAHLEDAHLEHALAIADLGDAIHRRYKTYSNGMKQRLGLAQALLGQPDLLVLDEPTSGLDPQQMREIRDVVRRAGESGVTVLLSSHLLSEVEQVCDHAAVMNRGRLVSAGTVNELTGASTTVYLEVDETDRAISVLRSLKGVERVVPDGRGLTLALDGIERRALVSTLVGAGVGVETVTSRNRLEDAFIDLLDDSSV
jgi:ABC-2 type transport system ATP-binding protein